MIYFSDLEKQKSAFKSPFQMINIVVGMKTFEDTNNGQDFKKMRKNVREGTHKDKRQKRYEKCSKMGEWLQKEKNNIYKNTFTKVSKCKQKVKLRIRE